MKTPSRVLNENVQSWEEVFGISFTTLYNYIEELWKFVNYAKPSYYTKNVKDLLEDYSKISANNWAFTRAVNWIRVRKEPVFREIYAISRKTSVNITKFLEIMATVYYNDIKLFYKLLPLLVKDIKEAREVIKDPNILQKYKEQIENEVLPILKMKIPNLTIPYDIQIHEYTTLAAVKYRLRKVLLKNGFEERINICKLRNMIGLKCRLGNGKRKGIVM